MFFTRKTHRQQFTLSLSTPTHRQSIIAPFTTYTGIIRPSVKRREMQIIDKDDRRTRKQTLIRTSSQNAEET